MSALRGGVRRGKRGRRRKRSCTWKDAGRPKKQGGEKKSRRTQAGEEGGGRKGKRGREGRGEVGGAKTVEGRGWWERRCKEENDTETDAARGWAGGEGGRARSGREEKKESARAQREGARAQRRSHGEKGRSSMATKRSWVAGREKWGDERGRGAEGGMGGREGGPGKKKRRGRGRAFSPVGFSAENRHRKKEEGGEEGE